MMPPKKFLMLVTTFEMHPLMPPEVAGAGVAFFDASAAVLKEEAELNPCETVE
jgi:hypothetical protein